MRAGALHAFSQVMQLIIVVGEIHLANEVTIGGEFGSTLMTPMASLPILARVEQSSVNVFGSGLHRHARRRVKARIRH
jgi:hypothetical protein